MNWLFYELKMIPDLSLMKYQSLSEQGIDGVLKKMESFLRQWQKISATYSINIHMYIAYNPGAPVGEKISIYQAFSFLDNVLIDSITSLIKASPLSDYYVLSACEEIPENLKKRKFDCKYVLKKCERVRDCVKKEGNESIPLYFVESWKGNEEGRLYDMLKTLSALDKEMVYCVSLFGIDSYEKIYSALEKPINFLRNKTINAYAKDVQLIKDNSHPIRDVVAEETLKVYEGFLKDFSGSPCFQGDIYVLSNDSISANMVLNTVCGESIEEGNWDIMELERGNYNVLDEIVLFNRIMPKSLSFWPTIFTLEEIAPFFRLPAIYEGELLEIKKETEAREQEGELFLGTNNQKHNINFPVKLLNKHAFVCGVPGAGKTNTMLHICYTLWKKCKIPFLVLEPAKKEYRALAQTDIDELMVFSPSSGSKFPLAINPFEFPKGMSLSEHIQNLMDVFEGAFPLTPPLPALLDRAIEGIYVKHGWDTEDINDGSRAYPTMSELYRRLEYQLEMTDYDGEIRGNMKSALEMRIGGLLRRDLGNVFDVSYSSLMPEELMESPVIIEMESMGRGPSNFLTLMLCTLIREVLRVNPDASPDKPVRHVILIEEAHNLIATATDDVRGDDANPKIAATNYIVNMLAEVRALRESIIIADQLPTAMAPEVIKNTNLKIVHRLTSGDDRSLIGSTMSASESQIEELSTYTPGNALVTYEGLLKPFKIQIQEFKLKEAPTTETLISLMKCRQLQKDISQITIEIRLDKIKKKWVSEWNIMLEIYKKLSMDCRDLKNANISADINRIRETIVKDQLGLEECIKQLNKVIRNYERVLSLAIEDRATDEFLENMKQDVEKIIITVRNTIKKCIE